MSSAASAWVLVATCVTAEWSAQYTIFRSRARAIYHHSWRGLAMVIESTCPAWPRPRRRAGRAASRPPGAETLPVPRRAPFRVFGRGTAIPVPFVACIGSEQCRSAPPCRAAAGPQAAGAENRDEPWGPLGDAKWIFKPGAASVTSSTISTRALKPKYEHRKNAPNLWAASRARHPSLSYASDPSACIQGNVVSIQKPNMARE